MGHPGRRADQATQLLTVSDSSPDDRRTHRRTVPSGVDSAPLGADAEPELEDGAQRGEPDPCREPQDPETESPGQLSLEGVGVPTGADEGLGHYALCSGRRRPFHVQKKSDADRADPGASRPGDETDPRTVARWSPRWPCRVWSRRCELLPYAPYAREGHASVPATAPRPSWWLANFGNGTLGFPRRRSYCGMPGRSSTWLQRLSSVESLPGHSLGTALRSRFSPAEVGIVARRGRGPRATLSVSSASAGRPCVHAQMTQRSG